MGTKISKIVFIVAVLTACIGGAEREGRNVPRVAVFQDRAQEWADALKLGFVDGLEEEGFTVGELVHVRLFSAAGQDRNLDQVVNEVRRGGFTVVYTLGTQASQRYFDRMDSGAMVFGAVTDPIEAGFYDTDLDHPRKNLTGSQDLWPYAAQFALMRVLLPEATTIGTLFNPSEVNSQVSIRFARAAAQDQGFDLVERPVPDDRTVEAAVGALLSSRVAAIYIPADNTAQSQSATIISIANQAGIPVFTGISGIVERGAIGTVGTNYYEVGRVNGLQVAEILRGSRADSLPVAIADRGDIYLNLAAAARHGINVPDSLIARAFQVFR